MKIQSTSNLKLRQVCGLALLFCLGSGFLWAAPGDAVLKPEWNGPCVRCDVIDVDLGNAPEAFVRAAWCQVYGSEAPAAQVQAWAAKLRADKRLRRVDLVRTFLAAARRAAKLKYSSPWVEAAIPACAPCQKKAKRDIGAVLMFFFHCPGGTNCGMDWANSHAFGMAEADPALGFGAAPTGYYDPKNPGFWRRELQDAKDAGLQFVLPNVYGPDMYEGRLQGLATALKAEADPVKIGMFDDTWAWGKPYFGEFWATAPGFSNAEEAAKKLYFSKWKPFFTLVPQKNWFLVKGRPVIFFYNGGTLTPASSSGPVIQRMKKLFQKDFGMEPFVAADSAFYADPRMKFMADARFKWDTRQEPQGVSRYSQDGFTLCHAMVKWDAVGRDKPGKIADASDVLIKSSDILENVLKVTANADMLILGTWNDLGEGTGLNRCFDYYYLGQWLAPDHFMKLIRRSQCR
jgi:hypothetical protein